MDGLRRPAMAYSEQRYDSMPGYQRVPKSADACQFVRHASAYAWTNRFPVYTIYRNIDRCASSDAWTPYAWECAPTRMVHRRNIYSKSCTCMVCLSGGSASAIANWTAARMLSDSRDDGICMVCHRCGCECVAVGVTIG